MRKFAGIFVFIFGVLTSFAHAQTVEMTCFEGEFIRKPGKPIIETVTFPGVSGPATIKVINGSEGRNKKISSAVIKLNGTIVIDSSSFNQKVNFIETRINMEEGINELSVELRSKPGGKIHLSVVQEKLVDSPSVSIWGQAILGPLSGAEIAIRDLDGVLIATAYADDSPSVENAGSFLFSVSEKDIPELVIVTACGGVDIDSDDDGIWGPQIDNQGCIHAYITKPQLLNRFIINPLTEIIFQELSIMHPDGINNLTLDEIVSFLDDTAKKYCSYAENYEDILSFIPSIDKSGSLITWETIISKFVKGIHDGESDSNIKNRVLYLNSLLQPEGVMTSSDGNFIVKLEDDGKDRIKTTIKKTDDGLVGIFEQSFVGDSGALVYLRVEKMSDTQSYLKASISIADHILEVEGITNLLQDVLFSEENILSSFSKLITLEISDDGSLDIDIDKSLTSKISDNEIIFKIDGRKPTVEELTVVLDDPRINWKWSNTSMFLPKLLASGYVLPGYNNSDLKIFNDGTVIIELSLDDYEKVSGLKEDSDGIYKDALKHIASLLAGELGNIELYNHVYSGIIGGATSDGENFLFHFLKGALLSVPEALYWVADTSLLISERSLPSTRIKLLGEFTGEDKTEIIQGEKYIPLIFFRNVNHPNGTNFKINMVMHYETVDYRSLVISDNNQMYWHDSVTPMANFTANCNKGYVIIPAKQTSFFVSQKGNSVFNSDQPRVSLYADTDKIDFKRREHYLISTDNQSLYVDFYYIQSGNSYYLDASPCVSSDGTIKSYKWIHNGIEIASGKNAVVPVTDVDSGNGYGNVTLFVRTITGQFNEVTKIMPLDETFWNNPIVYAESFSSDPGYIKHISSNVSSYTSLAWDNGSYFAQVYDTNALWYCVAESPTFKTKSADESFRIEFDFNPVTPRWGNYPGIYFVNSSDGYFPIDRYGALQFTINWADYVYKKFTLRGYDGSQVLSPTIPAENEWYHVIITKNGATGNLSLVINRQDGTKFVDLTELDINAGSFDQIYIGEIGNSPKYGDRARIKVDNITIR